MMASDDAEYDDDYLHCCRRPFPCRRSATVADVTSDSDRCLAYPVGFAPAAVSWALEVEHFEAPEPA